MTCPFRVEKIPTPSQFKQSEKLENGVYDVKQREALFVDVGFAYSLEYGILTQLGNALTKSHNIYFNCCNASTGNFYMAGTDR